MKRFVEGDDRKQVALLPECVDDYIGQDNPVRVINVFVDELDLEDLSFNGTTAAVTGRPSYHPGVMLKIYIYGYLNRVPSSRRLERECQRNVEMMWLTGGRSRELLPLRGHSGKTYLQCRSTHALWIFPNVYRERSFP
jgi:transposase